MQPDRNHYRHGRFGDCNRGLPVQNDYLKQRVDFLLDIPRGFMVQNHEE